MSLSGKWIATRNRIVTDGTNEPLPWKYVFLEISGTTLTLSSEHVTTTYTVALDSVDNDSFSKTKAVGQRYCKGARINGKNHLFGYFAWGKSSGEDPYEVFTAVPLVGPAKNDFYQLSALKGSNSFLKSDQYSIVQKPGDPTKLRWSMTVETNKTVDFDWIEAPLQEVFSASASTTDYTYDLSAVVSRNKVGVQMVICGRIKRTQKTTSLVEDDTFVAISANPHPFPGGCDEESVFHAAFDQEECDRILEFLSQ